ncbi:MAG TPA: NAD-dependent epimerase/dehydratase family protein, partial [Candidatus Limnocylindria bacterium]|nr:NAD-dependent epimerase/dehydratase family protein [Candidatus Limnocylindria bacterium]
MRTLVTGGAGFIGSAVADAYVAGGHDVAVIDDLSAGDPAHVDPRVRLYRVDVTAGGIDAVLAAERPEVVNHHAAHVSVRRSVDDPHRDATINVLGAINVLEAARRHGVRRVIFASTGGAIYGEQDGPPADETHPCRPRSPYAVAKLAVEHYLDYYRATYGLETIILRYANVYGP